MIFTLTSDTPDHASESTPRKVVKMLMEKRNRKVKEYNTAQRETGRGGGCALGYGEWVQQSSRVQEGRGEG